MHRCKSSWGRARQLDEHLWRVRLRNPHKSLVVNTFVYRGGGILAVIDPGWPYTVDALAEAFADMEPAASLADVDAWIYTHSHIDHMGAAALLAERSDAPHLAWRGLRAQLGRWHAFQDEVHRLSPWVKEAFVEPHRAQILSTLTEEYSLLDHHGPAQLERVELVDFGDRVEVGDLTLEWVDARGHDPYHSALWEPGRGWLFSGDVTLAVPTPICRAMGDRLDTYRASLDRLQGLDTSLLLPGHGLHRNDHIDELFERSRGFVDQYEASTLTALERAGEPVDLYNLALGLTPDGRPLSPSGRWWVHLALVDAHLHALIEAGRVVKLDRNDGPWYALG